MTDLQPEESPHWSWTTKLIAGLSLVAIIGWLVIRFQNFLSPLIVVFILAYILYPFGKLVSQWLRIPWRLAVSLIYLIFIVILGGLLTLGGLALISQLQSLINFLQQALIKLPTFIQGITQQVFRIGPFQFALSQIDINSVSNQILSAIQPLLGRLGSILGIVATSAATLLGWAVFVLVVSYFILVESHGIPGRIFRIRIPAYDADIKRFGVELTRIWNSFLRGQIIVTSLTILIYIVLLGSFRLPFYLGLAVLAGIAKFIPYIGELIMWITYGLVTYFGGSPPLGLSPIIFAVIVVGCAMLVDSTIDNLVSPRIIARAVKVHPAAVMVAALIGLSLLGLIGMIVAAPILATLQLFLNYTFRKMLDQDPWEEMEPAPNKQTNQFIQQIQKKVLPFIKRSVQGSSIFFFQLWKRLGEKH